jgi:hypothetical protein
MTHRGSSPNGHRSSFSINGDSVHLPQVNHKTAFRQRPASDTMPTTPNGNLKPVMASNMNGTYNIIHTGALSDNAGSAIDHGIKNFSSFIIVRLTECNDPASEAVA